MPTAFSKSFWGLIVTQFLGAFNDNVLKVLITLLIVQWVGDPIQRASLVDLTGAVFVAPFLIFSMIAGRLSDRFPKSYIIRTTKFWELVVVVVAVWSLWMESIPFMLVALFMIAAQSALFSPSKYGILPELMGQEKLSEANAYLNIATFAAILLGTLAASFLAAHRLWAYAVMAIAAVLGVWSAYWIEPTRLADPNKPLKWNVFTDLIANWKLITPNQPLKYSVLAINYFWFMGAAMQLNIFLYAKEHLFATDQQTGLLIVALAIGIGVGSFIVGRFSRSRVQLGWVPMGAFGMSLFAIALRFSMHSQPITAIILFSIGLFAGFYEIPLAALIQWESPATERGRILATVNFFSFVAILMASGVLFVLAHVFHQNPANVFLWLGVGSFCFFGSVWMSLPSMRQECRFSSNQPKHS